MPISENFTKSKKGNSWEMTKLTFHDKSESFEISLEKEKAIWLVNNLDKLAVFNDIKMNFNDLKLSFETNFENFELFFNSKPINTLKEFGLLVL